ncbi:MAG: YidC/Oxa1 family membrane protein insertase [Nibricoccus sp.]
MDISLTALFGSLVNVLGGNLGWAILALSLGIRVALLPLTLRLARRAFRNQKIAQALQPEIDAIKKKFEKKPEQLFGEIQKVYKKHGYNPLDLRALLGSFVQLPIFGMLYRTIRDAITKGGAFLWIRNLASPDAWLTLGILTLTGLSAYFLPNANEAAKGMLIFIQVAITVFIVWKLAAGLGLYWAASSAVGLGQNLWLRWRLRRENENAMA